MGKGVCHCGCGASKRESLKWSKSVDESRAEHFKEHCCRTEEEMTVILQLTLATLTLTSALGLQTYPQMFHFECPKGTCKKKRTIRKRRLSRRNIRGRRMFLGWHFQAKERSVREVCGFLLITVSKKAAIIPPHNDFLLETCSSGFFSYLNVLFIIPKIRCFHTPHKHVQLMNKQELQSQCG